MTLIHQEMEKARARASLGVTGKTRRHLVEMKGGKREVGQPKGHTAVAVKVNWTHQADREKKKSAKGTSLIIQKMVILVKGVSSKSLQITLVMTEGLIGEGMTLTGQKSDTGLMRSLLAADVSSKILQIAVTGDLIGEGTTLKIQRMATVLMKGQSAAVVSSKSLQIAMTEGLIGEGTTLKSLRTATVPTRDLSAAGA